MISLSLTRIATDSKFESMFRFFSVIKFVDVLQAANVTEQYMDKLVMSENYANVFKGILVFKSECNIVLDPSLPEL